MSAQNLPYEIYQLIFQHLQNQTVYQCIFVCKSWSMAATHEYYQNFTLTGNIITFLQQKLSLNSNQIDSMPGLVTQGALVRTLNIDKDRSSRARLDAKEFSTVLSHMPNIRKLDLNSTAKYRYYLQKLQNSKRNAVYLKCLEEISIDDKFPPAKADGIWDYFEVCHKYCKTITHLYLSRLVKHGFYEVDNFVKYINLLPDFKSLTHLHIDNSSTTALICPIIKNCPNLTNFTYKSKLAIDNDITAELLSLKSSGDITASDSRATINAPTTADPVLSIQQQRSYFHNQHCRNLKKMHLSASYIDMKCLMLYIPPQLDTLEICADEKLLDFWFQENDTDTLVQFGRQLRSIRIVNIAMGKSFFRGHYFWYERSALPRNLERAITVEQKSCKYWILIDTLTKGRNLTVNFTLHFYVSNREPQNFFKFDVSDYRANLQYSIDVNDYIRDEKTRATDIPPIFQIGYGDSIRKAELPAIHSLEVNMKDGSYYGSNIESTKVNRMIEYIVLNCHHLNHIEIKGFIRNYQFKSGKNQVLTSTAENLTQCYLKGVAFSPEFLTILNNSFQNIKFLELKDCSGFSADDYCNYHLDFSGLNRLEDFKLDMRNFNIKHSRLHILFQFEYLNGNGEENIEHYKYKKNALIGERFIATNDKFINSFNRVNSVRTTVTYFKFSSMLHAITLVCKHDDIEEIRFNTENTSLTVP